MKKFLFLALTINLLLALVTSVYAAPNKGKPTQPPPGIKYSTEEQEKEYLKDAEKYKIYGKSNVITPQYVPIDVGTTDVVPYIFPGSGAIRSDSKSGIFSEIKDFVLIVGNFLPGVGWTVASVVDSVSNFFGDYIAPDTPVTAETLYMYRYIGKEGRVYDGAKWLTKFDTRSRETYTVKNAYWYDSNNMPQGGQVVSSSPAKTEYSAHYFDDSYIRNEAYWNWYYNWYWVVETW